MRFLLTALILLASQPTWALYKCAGAGGAVSFQEQPCGGAQTQTAIKPLIEAPKMGAATEAAPRKSLQETSADLEKERLMHDTKYALRDKRAELGNFRASCAREVQRLQANGRGFNDNLAGAMRGQAEASAAQAQAATCDTQARAIEGDLRELERRCTAQKCNPAQ